VSRAFFATRVNGLGSDLAQPGGDEAVGLVANLYYQQDRGGPTYILKQVLIRSHVESHVENHVNR